eukprot:m.177593 g.177593  ORF g.177593 m.177593 type:complete len:381 (+) comp18373_c0_seq2:271-1413(+)
MSREEAARQGSQHFRAGEKALKTTMFKWKPDFELASEEFDKAGKQFCLAKNHAKAIEAFKLASNAHKQYDQLYHAAQSLEHAATAAKDAKMTDAIGGLLSQAAALYRRNGTGDAAALALEKAAKDAEKRSDYDAALALWLEVVDIRDTEDQTRRMKVPLDRAIQMTIRLRKFPKTIELLNQEAILYIGLKDDNNLNRNWLCRMIVQLEMGNFADAEKLYEEALTGAFASSDEQLIADQMLNAYDEKDQDKLNEVTRQQIFSFLSNDIAVLARKLKAQGGTGRSVRNLEELTGRMETNNKLVVNERAAGAAAAPPRDDDITSVSSNVTALSAMPAEAAEMHAHDADAARSASGGAEGGVADDAPPAGGDGGDESEEEDDLL